MKASLPGTRFRQFLFVLPLLVRPFCGHGHLMTAALPAQTAAVARSEAFHLLTQARHALAPAHAFSVA